MASILKYTWNTYWKKKRKAVKRKNESRVIYIVLKLIMNTSFVELKIQCYLIPVTLKQGRLAFKIEIIQKWVVNNY